MSNKASPDASGLHRLDLHMRRYEQTHRYKYADMRLYRLVLHVFIYVRVCICINMYIYIYICINIQMSGKLEYRWSHERLDSLTP